MQGYYEFTENYYPGFQKASLLSDVILRKTFFIFTGVTLVTIPLCYIVPDKYLNVMFVLIGLVLTLPLCFGLAGGLPASVRGLYAASAALFALGTVPVLMGGSGWFLVLVPLSLFLFYRLHRKAPHLLQAFGYTGYSASLREILLTAGCLAVLVVSTWYAFEKTQSVSFLSLNPKTFFMLLCAGIIIVAPVYGAFFGILTRRLLDMKYQLGIAIIINIVLYNIISLPAALIYENPGLALLGNLSFAVVQQIVLGLAYYFCRSARIMFFAQLFFYVFLETIKLST